MRRWINKIQGKQSLEEEAKYQALIGEMGIAFQVIGDAASLADQTPNGGKTILFCEGEGHCGSVMAFTPKEKFPSGTAAFGFSAEIGGIAGIGAHLAG